MCLDPGPEQAPNGAASTEQRKLTPPPVEERSNSTRDELPSAPGPAEMLVSGGVVSTVKARVTSSVPASCRENTCGPSPSGDRWSGEAHGSTLTSSTVQVTAAVGGSEANSNVGSDVRVDEPSARPEVIASAG